MAASVRVQAVCVASPGALHHVLHLYVWFLQGLGVCARALKCEIHSCLALRAQRLILWHRLLFVSKEMFTAKDAEERLDLPSVTSLHLLLLRLSSSRLQGCFFSSLSEENGSVALDASLLLSASC